MLNGHYTPKIAAKIVRYQNQTKIPMTFLQRNEYLNIIKNLPQEDKRIGCEKYLTSYVAFLLVKRLSNGLNVKTLECYNKPYDNLAIVAAVKEIIPELYESFWVKNN